MAKKKGRRGAKEEDGGADFLPEEHTIVGSVVSSVDWHSHEENWSSDDGKMTRGYIPTTT